MTFLSSNASTCVMAVTMRYRQQLFSISDSSAGGVISNVCTTTTYRGLHGFLVPLETVSTLVANHQGFVSMRAQ